MRPIKFITMTALWLSPAAITPAWAEDAAQPDQATAPAAATTAQDEADEEQAIVVTGARGRAEVAQNVPVAITVLGAAQIQESQARTLNDLDSLAPNVTITTMGNISGTAGISIRGFSAVANDPSAEPGVAVYIDGVYQVQNFGSLSNLYDVGSLELLSGPQSALLGKSASAGALLINHSRPTGVFGVRAEVEYGNYDEFRADLLVNFPIVQGVLAGKVYSGYERRDGFMRNVVVPGYDMGGVDRRVVRGALLFTPSSQLEVYVTADYNWDRSSQGGGRNTTASNRLLCTTYGVCNPYGNQYKVVGSTFLRDPSLDYYNFAGHATWRPGTINITSITGYSRLQADLQSDLDGVPGAYLHLNQQYDIKAFSEEVRVTPESGGGLDMGGRLSWILGGFYGHSTSDSQTANTVLLVTRDQNAYIVRNTYAVFGQLDFEIIDNLTLSAGARRSHDSVRHDYNFAAVTPGPDPYPTPFRPRNLTHSTSFNNTSFEGGIRYRFMPNRMIYFRYAEGFRGGGFNGFPGNANAALPYRPETTTGYEFGAKTTWLNGNLQVNLAIFQVDFTDLQRTVSVLFPSGQSASVVTNAASARTRGLELQTIARPLEGLQLRASFGYLDAKYLNYQSYNAGTGTYTDLSGQPVTLAPEFTVAADFGYTIQLSDNGFFNTAVLRGAVSWRDDFEMSNILDPVGHQEGYATVDASVEFARSADFNYSLRFYVKNAFDQRFQNWANASGGFLQTHNDDIGRTYGVILGLRF